MSKGADPLGLTLLVQSPPFARLRTWLDTCTSITHRTHVEKVMAGRILPISSLRACIV